MRFSRKTDGNKRGAANRRIPRRRYRLAAAAMDAGGPSIPIEKMNMLQRLQYASNYFFAQAESERKKGDRADVTVIVALMQAGAMLAAKAAPYIHPKVAAIQLEVSQPQRPKVDIRKLTDDELDDLERLVKKAKLTPPDAGQQPIP